MTSASNEVAIVPGQPRMLSASEEYAFTADLRRLTMLHLGDALLRRVLG